MKLIKLDRRHNLYRQGYQYAFLFTEYGSQVPDSYAVERYVCKAEGLKWYENTFYGKREKHRDRTPYYVGFHKESTATLVRLKLA
jgi:hypothetical protein